MLDSMPKVTSERVEDFMSLYGKKFNKKTNDLYDERYPSLLRMCAIVKLTNFRV